MKDRYGEERHFYIMHDNCVIDSVKMRSIYKIITEVNLLNTVILIY